MLCISNKLRNCRSSEWIIDEIGQHRLDTSKPVLHRRHVLRGHRDGYKKEENNRLHDCKYVWLFQFEKKVSTSCLVQVNATSTYLIILEGLMPVDRVLSEVSVKVPSSYHINFKDTMSSVIRVNLVLRLVECAHHVVQSAVIDTYAA